MVYTLICHEVLSVAQTELFGKFTLARFKPGDALTVANTLRRTLLSQLSGVAIAYANIVGANHEYAPLKGIQQLPLDILVNLNQVVLKSDVDQFQPQVAFLDIRGPAKVQAKHLLYPFFIHCVNPDHVIAYINETGRLQLKILIVAGQGTKKTNIDHAHAVQLFHVNSQSSSMSDTLSKPQNPGVQRQNAPLKSQCFPVNSVLSPVKRVNYNILPAVNNAEAVHLEVWTNGSVDPKTAINEASKSVIQLFLPLQNFVKPPGQTSSKRGLNQRAQGPNKPTRGSQSRPMAPMKRPTVKWTNDVSSHTPPNGGVSGRIAETVSGKTTVPNSRLETTAAGAQTALNQGGPGFIVKKAIVQPPVFSKVQTPPEGEVSWRAPLNHRTFSKGTGTQKKALAKNPDFKTMSLNVNAHNKKNPSEEEDTGPRIYFLLPKQKQRLNQNLPTKIQRFMDLTEEKRQRYYANLKEILVRSRYETFWSFNLTTVLWYIYTHATLSDDYKRIYMKDFVTIDNQRQQLQEQKQPKKEQRHKNPLHGLIYLPDHDISHLYLRVSTYIALKQHGIDTIDLVGFFMEMAEQQSGQTLHQITQTKVETSMSVAVFNINQMAESLVQVFVQHQPSFRLTTDEAKNIIVRFYKNARIGFELLTLQQLKQIEQHHAAHLASPNPKTKQTRQERPSRAQRSKR